MKFPYSMLLDFVETKLDAEAVGDLLTMAGFELEGIEEVEGDSVLDIKVMSNRGDGLSVMGLAREVYAKDESAKLTELYVWAASGFTDASEHEGPIEGVSVAVETDDCTRYACLVFDQVENGTTPEWIQKRLRQAGQRPISLLVDLTNYVMLELGQPLHAFDLDKLRGGKIIVRKARAGEWLKTLNGVDNALLTDQMMICDAERPVAAAGIMGGEATEVDSGTRRMLLESAHFVNTSVRRTRKQLGLNTEASYRFERSVDPEGVVAALERFAELFASAKGKGRRVAGRTDVRPYILAPKSVQLDLRRAERLLGMPITDQEAADHLSRLGFGFASGFEGRTARVIVPSWRPDVVREEDLVEELGRVHGFEKIPAELPRGSTLVGGSYGFDAWLQAVRQSLVRAGFTQTVSHSLRDRGPLDEPEAEGIEIRNPNSPEMAWLRSSLMGCLADNARRNGGRDLHLFEIGRVFFQASGEMSEHVRAALWSQGQRGPTDWLDKDPAPSGFFTMKGALQEMFAVAGVDAQYLTGSDPRLHPTKQALLSTDGGAIGILGQLNPDLADELGVPEDSVVAELYLEPMYDGHHAAPKLKQLSRNPSVRRDIALLIDKSVPYQKVEQALSSSIGDVLEKHWLFDVYEGKGIPEGKHSLAIALQLRKPGANFTDEEANQVREKAVLALAALGGTLR